MATLTTIGDVVDEYIIEAGYDSRQQYSRLLNMAIRGLKDLTYDVSGEPTWDLLTLDDNNRSTIPDGLVKIIGIYMNSNDGLQEVVESTKLAPTIVNSDGEEVTPENVFPTDYETLYNNYYYNSAKHFQNGQYIGAQYAGVESNPFKYRRNYDTNRLEFSSNVSSPVIEYLKDPKMVNGKHVVHPFLMDAIMYWISFADVRFKNNIPSAEKNERQRRYLAAKNLAARRLVSLSTGNFRDAARAGYSLTTK